MAMAKLMRRWQKEAHKHDYGKTGEFDDLEHEEYTPQKSKSRHKKTH